MNRAELAAWGALILTGCHSSKSPAPPVPTPAELRIGVGAGTTPRPEFRVFPEGASPASGREEFEQPVTAIATALWATCALLEDHSVWCWGDDHSHIMDGYQEWPRQIPLTGCP